MALANAWAGMRWTSSSPTRTEPVCWQLKTFWPTIGTVVRDAKCHGPEGLSSIRVTYPYGRRPAMPSALIVFLYKSSLILRAVSGASWAVKMKHPANCSICFRSSCSSYQMLGSINAWFSPIHCIQMGTVRRLSNSSWAFADEASVKVLLCFDYCLGRLTASKDFEISPESFPEELLQTIACLSTTGQNPFQRLRSKLCS